MPLHNQDATIEWFVKEITQYLLKIFYIEIYIFRASIIK